MGNSLATRMLRVAEAAVLSTQRGKAAWVETDKPGAYLYTGANSSLVLERGSAGSVRLTLLASDGRTVGSLGDTSPWGGAFVPGVSSDLEAIAFQTQARETLARLYTLVEEGLNDADAVIEDTLRDLESDF